MKLIKKYIVLLLVGGIVYTLIELGYRGRSHYSMTILGGLSFVYCGIINEWFTWKMPLLKQCVIGSIGVTMMEFICGVIVNTWLNLGVWDYSNMPFNFLGQICLPFSILWIFMAGIAIVLDDYLRYWWFNEKKPLYNLKLR